VANVQKKNRGVKKRFFILKCRERKDFEINLWVYKKKLFGGKNISYVRESIPEYVVGTKAFFGPSKYKFNFIKQDLFYDLSPKDVKKIPD